jgi:tRNA(Ile)-lysidine synthase
MLEDMSPGFHSRMKQTAERIAMEWTAWEITYTTWEKEHVHAIGDSFDIKAEPGHESFLLRWLENHGIPWSLAHDFVRPAGQGGSKVLKYGSTLLSRTRNGFHLEQSEGTPFLLTIDHEGEYHTDACSFSLERVDLRDFSPVAHPGIAFISGDVLQFPLHIRNIEPGDDFEPLGMPGKTKKIQDLLVDRKLEMHEKKRTLVVHNPHHILWVIDQQLDDRAKVKPVEKSIYRLEFRWTR